MNAKVLVVVTVRSKRTIWYEYLAVECRFDCFNTYKYVSKIASIYY